MERTHSKEQPLQFLAVLLQILHGVEAVDVVRVEDGDEVEEDGGCFEDIEAGVGERGDTAVGVYLVDVTVSVI